MTMSQLVFLQCESSYSYHGTLFVSAQERRDTVPEAIHWMDGHMEGDHLSHACALSKVNWGGSGL